jgi:hypothetical protein
MLEINGGFAACPEFSALLFPPADGENNGQGAAGILGLGLAKRQFSILQSCSANRGQLKTRSLSRSDQLAKYNQLLRIEHLLGRKVDF